MVLMLIDGRDPIAECMIPAENVGELVVELVEDAEIDAGIGIGTGMDEEPYEIEDLGVPGVRGRDGWDESRYPWL